MGSGLDVAAPLQALAHPARAAMAVALLGGTALTAGQLADQAGVSASRASWHLRNLTAAGLVSVRSHGRNRLFELASPEVARLLESAALLSRPVPVGSLRATTAREMTRYARSCYDHLAGVVGVAVFEHLVAIEALFVGQDGVVLSPSGAQRLAPLGVDVGNGRVRRPAALLCQDYTERRPHLAGRVGAQLLTSLLDRGWVVRGPGRSLRVTGHGRDGFRQVLEMELPDGPRRA